MAQINLARVLIGGIAAGVVANVLDFAITSYLMAGELAEMLTRLSIDPEAIGSSVTVFVVVDFVWGLLLVFTYAAIRPRFGPGPKTAVITGIILWLAIVLLEAQLTAIGIWTLVSYIQTSVVYLLSGVAASLVGSALYKEKSDANRGAA